ncbi:1-deoxy-D-xylulose-5-phosphate synthase [Candidatus Oleimmundimicrobium sp.]|uniref:1-deoxy-D-xylulose-5-phosphate synthase n=1 Tax=Candidatus Oleimmundimicrobium sp. TaxID=3060597 RepID=UPI002726ABB5|nr:1-deoxy-D-xylulose-5-phosphate synthase [Candidatus Oleimmundimicrobium sp.]MDO8886522.1 1-deoxy-D-xylulose-5-phosphate synthase [Candidatus Oleimmundimicrobium sp.]
MAKILNKISYPSDLKKLSSNKLRDLAEEIREEIINVVSKNGGHLASSLGVVELTIGLHLALNCPEDKIVWDVGHQSYAHKILTGRRKKFKTLRQYNGISGFPKRSESKYDVFDTGHASNSISVALGLAEARKQRCGNETIVAVMGDGSLTGGEAYEGLNQAGHLGTPLIVILNDNEMSISNNVGAFSAYLSRIRFDPTLYKIREEIEERIIKIIKNIPTIGAKVSQAAEGLKESFKHVIIPGMIFEELGFKYIGPIDGHKIDSVVSAINLAKEVKKPVLIHVVTKKGKGYPPAEKCPDKFHGVGSFIIKTGESAIKDKKPTYTNFFGDAMVELASKNNRIVGITAAMSGGTGLSKFAEFFPDRFYDVGIAEQHAVTFAAGLALDGHLPVVAIYSTFLQRAFDQIIQDVCLQNLHVIFAVDRAGLVGEDGPTHHGAFDLTYLRQIPGMTVMVPKDEAELRNMLYTATKLNGPVAIRYPRGPVLGVKYSKRFKKIKVSEAEIVKEGKDVCLLAIGRMVQKSYEACNVLEDMGISCTLVNARFVKPLDEKTISELAMKHKLIVSIEENTLLGGFGSSVLELLAAKGISVPFLQLGLPDNFITHGPINILLSENGLDGAGIVAAIKEKIKQIKGFQVRL